MMLPTSRKSSSSNPRIVAAWLPTRTPDAIVGGRSSNGTVLRFVVTPTACSRSSASLPDHSVSRRSSWRRCVSVPPVTQVDAAAEERLAEHVGVRADLALVVAEAVRPGDQEAGRLRGDHVLERPALEAGEDRAVDRLRVLLAAEDEPRARPGQGLVRRRGDDVAVARRDSGWRPAATSPAKCAMSHQRSAPTSSAIRRNIAVSTVRG